MEELSLLGILGENIEKEYGERLIKSIMSFVELENLQKYIDINGPKRRQISAQTICATPTKRPPNLPTVMPAKAPDNFEDVNALHDGSNITTCAAADGTASKKPSDEVITIASKTDMIVNSNDNIRSSSGSRQGTPQALQRKVGEWQQRYKLLVCINKDRLKQVVREKLNLLRQGNLGIYGLRTECYYTLLAEGNFSAFLGVVAKALAGNDVDKRVRTMTALQKDRRIIEEEVKLYQAKDRVVSSESSIAQDPRSKNHQYDKHSTTAPYSHSVTSQAAASPLLLLFLCLPLSSERGNTFLDTSMWDYLSLRDLAQLRLLSHRLRKALERVQYTRCRDGRGYLVPFPGFPGVLKTEMAIMCGSSGQDNDGHIGNADESGPTKMVQGLFRHQLASLEAMHKAENRCTNFGALRGGILGDAPGLGKTITMLAMIVSTAGMRVRNPTEFWDEEAVQRGWESLRLNDAADEDIAKCLIPINRWVRNKLKKKSPGYRAYIELQNYVIPSYRDDRLQSLSNFAHHVRR
eukprot:15137842-Ditylum_brightwellii.AAC.1